MPKPLLTVPGRSTVSKETAGTCSGSGAGDVGAPARPHCGQGGDQPAQALVAALAGLVLYHHRVARGVAGHDLRGRGFGGGIGVLATFDVQRRAWPEFSGMGAPARTQPVQLASLEVVTQSSSFTGLPQYVSLI